MKSSVLLIGLIWVLAGGIAVAAEPAEDAGIPLGAHVFGDLRARQVGPAIMSGRISALDVQDNDPRLMYVGAGGGGVWRSRNGGINFEPVFEDHCQAIGSIAIDQARPDTVWVGTGETWVRNSVSVGDGIYKTVDGGKTWVNKGLAVSERIGEIIIHPTEPDIVYAAVLGQLWSASEERGLFKTTDGGETWEKILYIDENTGCSDIAIDPQEPDILYATMWQFRRSAAFFESGGPGSGLHKSMDGGKTWKKIENGLPEGDLGRISIAVMPSRTSVLYASVESEATAFYRSDDLGESWHQTTDQKSITGRPFYFSHLVPDPQDHDRIYKMNTFILVSKDGGERFTGVGGWVHADGHALWVNPNDPRHLVLGTDGGVYISHARGDGFRHVSNLPVSQFYRVAVDDREPFRVYGGLQDNGSWFAPSRSPSGIANSDWENLGGGDGFAVAIDRLDQDIVYWEWQGGNISRKDLRTGENKDIKPLPWSGGPDLRFNWNMPIVTSPTDATRLYVGSQFLHRSTDRGETWETISPDLSTDNKELQRQEESGGLTVDNTAAENHCTVFSICESPLNKNIIWVGTDDGNLQISSDDGKKWRKANDDIDGLPDGTWVSCVEASSHNPNEAFVTFDGHRSGDMQPHVYHTVDMGRNWTSISTEDVLGHAHVIRQDPVNADLLYLGTEKGLFITLDRGLNWARFEKNFPEVSVRDLVMQQRENSLVAGTHGLGIIIIDDVTPLRQLTRETLAQDVTIMDSKPAVLRIPRGGMHAAGNTHFAAGNPRSSAVLAYYLKKRHMFGEMKIEIFTPEGELLKTLPGGKRKGMNFVTWSPRLKPPKVAPSPVMNPRTSFAGAMGPNAPEGRYKYVMTKGKKTYEGFVDVGYDAAYPHDKADRKVQQEIVSELYGMLSRMAYVAEAAEGLRDDAREQADQLKEKDKLARQLREFADDVEEFHSTLMVTDDVQGIGGKEKLREKVVGLYAAIAGYGGLPTAGQRSRLEDFRADILKANEEFVDLTAKPLEKLNKKLSKKEMAPLNLLTLEEYEKKNN